MDIFSLQIKTIKEMLDWRVSLDIILITLLIFFLYRTLKTTGTEKVFLGIVIAAIIFIFARRLDLKGIEWIYSNLSPIFLRALVIIFLVNGEFIRAKLEPRNQNEITPKGYQATVGYFINKKSQLLARWDSFDADNAQPQSEWLILGYNFFPTQITELQVNYVIPVEETSDYNQLLINLQLSF